MTVDHRRDIVNRYIVIFGDASKQIGIKMPDTGNKGHRQRLRDRFAIGDENSRSEEALLELLLTYAIPQKDVQPIAQQLLANFGGLSSLLETPMEMKTALSGPCSGIRIGSFMHFTNYATRGSSARYRRSITSASSLQSIRLLEWSSRSSRDVKRHEVHRNHRSPSSKTHGSRRATFVRCSGRLQPTRQFLQENASGQDHGRRSLP